MIFLGIVILPNSHTVFSAKVQIQLEQKHPFISAYKNEIFSIWEPTNAILNLDQFISSFLKEQHCLIELTNFLKIDLLNLQDLSEPILVQNLEIGLVEDEVLKVNHLFWMLENRNKSISFDPHHHPCQRILDSLIGSQTSYSTKLSHLCTHLNISLFTLISKAWKCHVKFDIFPPISYRYYELRFLPNLVKQFPAILENRLFPTVHPPPWYDFDLFDDTKSSSASQMKMSWSKSTPMINIFVVQAKAFNEIPVKRQIEIVSRWMEHSYMEPVTNSYYRSLLTHTFLLKTSFPFVKDEISNLNSVSEVQHILQVELCFRCEGQLLKLVDPGTKNVNKWDLRSSPEKYHSTELYIADITGGITRILDHFKICQNLFIKDDGHHALRNILEEFPKPDDKLFHLSAYLWRSIWKNYTYRIGKHVDCHNGQNVKITEEDPLEAEFTKKLKPGLGHILEFIPHPYHLPLFIKDKFHALQFVSCGRRGMESLTFGELISVYQIPVWICLLIFISVSALTLQSLLRNRKGSHWTSFLTAILKVLLEQGGPFPDDLLREKPLQILSGTLLLMGIVLSNGYKNTNVYNMILPRQPLQYHYFEELVKDGFLIYSKAGYINLQFKDEPKPEVVNHFVREISASGFIYLQSQIMEAWNRVKNSGGGGEGKQFELLDLVKNHTSLFPKHFFLRRFSD